MQKINVKGLHLKRVLRGIIYGKANILLSVYLKIINLITY
jgi:hypothetical protein